jgi:hypothetical protein
MPIVLQKFIDIHKPDAGAQLASEALIANYKTHLPACLLELWKEKGFGLYSNGLIQIINPELYKETLWGWLMRDEDMTRIPIAISAFGVIFYYRKLSDQGDEDVCFLDPHDSRGHDINWSLESFFNDSCCDSQFISEHLAKDMFDEAVGLHGKLPPNQMYCFVPALRLGGDRSAQSSRPGDANVQLNILLQLI